jgi:hypothetical protein
METGAVGAVGAVAATHRVSLAIERRVIRPVGAMSRRVWIEVTAVGIAAVAGALVGGRLRVQNQNHGARADSSAQITVQSARPLQMQAQAPAAHGRLPNFGGPVTIATDPSDPRYDAAALSATQVKRPAEIFSAEPRDPRWAPTMEAIMGKMVRSDVDALVPGAKEVAIECHTQTCRVAVRVENSDEIEKAGFALQIGTLGKTVAFAPNRRGSDLLEVYAVMNATSREIGAWSDLNRRKRKAFLEALEQLPPEQRPFPIENLTVE